MSWVQIPSPTPAFSSPEIFILCPVMAPDLYGNPVGEVPVNSIRCRGVLFDLDGVLVNSTPAVARVWAWWAREHGFDADKVVREAHGKPSIATIRELLPNADHEAENLEVERREIEDVEGVVPLPGALELLRALPHDKWAIVTSCTRPLAGVRIDAAGLPRPKFIVTSGDVRNGKPDPEPYLKGAQILRAPAAECVVIEDAPAGIRAGKAAGARVLAVRTTASDTELREAGADWIVDNCAELSVDPVGDSEEFLLLRRRTK
jgi:mannitol-1-/sugar-/sorbitol-6-phosphatase